MSYFELLKLVFPETILVIVALAVLVADFSMHGLGVRVRFLIGGMIACVGCTAAIVCMVVAPQHANMFDGMLVLDSLTPVVKVGVLALTIFTVLLSMDSDFTDHVGEYLALILLATLGMMFLVSSENVLMIFVALELTSLSLYILTAFNKCDVKSSEAALKYFLFGGMAAAFTLFGLSLLYGLSGSTNLREIAAAMSGTGVLPVSSASQQAGSVPHYHIDPLLIVAIVMTVIGFGFKIAAVPFHLWAPDAYQGAPTPSAALIASGSKVASIFIAAKVFALGFAGVEGGAAWHHYFPGWAPTLAVVAALSMILGNLVAIVQTSVKRLLAYSAIAHAGYMLLGVLSHSDDGLAALIYYVLTYGLTTVGAFGVVGAVEHMTGGDKLSDFAGLSRRAPVISFCMMIFMLSLAGIPPLAGFFGKFYVFTAAIKTGAPNLGLLWLVILAIATSAISLYYYLQVLKRIYVADATDATNAANVPCVPALTQIVLVVIALLVIALGCFPNLLVGCLQQCLATAH